MCMAHQLNHIIFLILKKGKLMNSSISQTIIDKIFSYDVFSKLDKNVLVKKYDFSDAIFDINSTIRSQEGQNAQTNSIISSIPPQGIVIDSPGTYTFADNLVWNPKPTACSAITIKASNVTLDMCNFTVKATIENRSQFIVGISIQNASEVVIENGSLAGMCFYGIYAEKVDHLTINNVTIEDLSFNNLEYRLLTPSGILISGANDISISSCKVNNLDVTSDASAGIQIIRTDKGIISDCHMSNFVNHDGSVQGYSYLLSSNIITSNCTSANFQSHFNGNILTLGHTVLGFIPTFCISLSYKNCMATNMIGCCDDCHGMSVFLDVMVDVDSFTADIVTDGVTKSNSGAKATGLEVYGVYISIKNSSATNIKAINPQDKQSTGFSAWGALISFTNCNASQVIVTNEHGITSPAFGYGTGFGWAPDPRCFFRDIGAYFVRYESCTATKCQVGFDTWDHVDSIWINVRYNDCGINILQEPYGSERILSGNPCSECNPPIIAHVKNIAKHCIII